MYYFAAAQNTSTAKSPAFLQRVQTEVLALQTNEAKITSENAFNGDNVWGEGNHEYSNKEKTLFWVFYRFLTRVLSLRPRNTYIYVFRAFFGFFIFYAICWSFGVSMNQFAAAQQTSTSKLLAFFQRFQARECARRVSEAKITTENVFN